MNIIGIGQPGSKAADGPSEATYFLTRDEKKAWVDALSARTHDEIPITIDHAGGEATMATAGDGSQPTGDGPFRVPNTKRIGRVSEGMVDEAGNLHVVGHLFGHVPETRAVIEGINTRGERWGFSLCTDVERVPGAVRNKKVTHVGLTRDPEYGPEGTWLYDARLSQDGIDEDLRQHYLSRPGMYIPAPMRARLEAARPLAGSGGGGGARHRYSVGATAAVTSETPTYISAAAPAPRPGITAPRPPMSSSSSLPPPTEQQQIQHQLMQQPPTPGGGELPPAPASGPNAEQRAAAIANYRHDLENLNRQVEEKYTQPGGGAEELDENKFYAAIALKEDYDTILTRSGFKGESTSKWPPGILRNLARLDDYIIGVNKSLQKVVDDATTSAENKKFYEESIRDPMQLRPVLAQVMATRNATLVSQREAEKRLVAERASMNDSLAAKEAELAQMRKELEQERANAKRAREEPDGGAYQQRTTTTPVAHFGEQQQQRQTPAPAAATQSTRGYNVMSVGATRSGGSSIGRPDAYWNNLGLVGADAEAFTLRNDPEVRRHIESAIALREQVRAQKLVGLNESTHGY